MCMFHFLRMEEEFLFFRDVVFGVHVPPISKAIQTKNRMILQKKKEKNRNYKFKHSEQTTKQEPEKQHSAHTELTIVIHHTFPL